MNSNDTQGDEPVRSSFLLFTEANQFGQVVAPDTLQTADLKALASVFKANIERIRDMASVPQIMANAATEYLLAYSESVFAVLGKPVMDDTDLQYIRKINAESRARATGEDTRPNAMKLYVTGVLNYHKYTYIPEYSAGFHALLSSLVVGAWTAFDALVTDAWIAAVNLSPRLAVGAYKDRSFKLERLQEHDYNWQGKVGELLAEKLTLSSFTEAKLAFRKIFPAMGDLHQTLEDLTFVSLVRNNLAHNAGIANKSFIEDTASFIPWANVIEGKPLPLDGPRVCELTNEIIHAGNHLLKAVDACPHTHAGLAPKSPHQNP